MKKIKKRIITFALIISFLVCCLPFSSYKIYANDNSCYTDVLEDLKKDTSFNEYSYLQNSNDYSLQVIQIAESDKLELFLYVYQPSGTTKNLIATSVNIATTFNQNLNFVNYKLDLINSFGVFYKYKVDELIVNAIEVREYEISSIYRAFDETIDENLENDNTIDEVNYNVSKHWTLTEDGTTCQDIETISIIDKYVGFVRYKDGDWWHLWGETACDRHFVAFSTDKSIDRLMEADIFYQTQSAHFRNYYSFMYVDSWTFGNVNDSYAYLNYSQKGNYDNGHYNYTWDRIQTVEDFMLSVNMTNTYSCGILSFENEANITDSNISELTEKEWVLSFLETSYELSRSGQEDNHYSTRVGNVSILRLKFETESIVYNLGVIDNKQTGSFVPINTYTTSIVGLSTDFTDTFKSVIGILFLILLLVLLWPLLPTILSFVWWLIKMLFSIVIWLISLPIKIIQFIFKKRE